MDGKTIVLGNGTGGVIHTSKNTEYGYIRVEQERSLFDNKGFLRRKQISALIPGTIDDLKKAGFYERQELPGKIVIIEQTEPFNKTNPDLDLKIAGSTGIVCTKNGKLIYRKHFYTVFTDADDEMIQHSNGDDISEAYLMEKTLTKLEPNEEFGL
jgi:hypothetical protein